MQADEHPQLRMWQDRLDAELAQQAAHAARRAIREAERQDWYAAWHEYKKHHTMEYVGRERPRWWNLPGWFLYLLRLHSPGRQN